MTQTGGRQAPDVVVGEVEDLQLGHPLEGLRLELHGPLLAAGPLAVVAADLQRAEVLEADEGGGGEELDLAELDGELVELELLPELVRVHDGLVEIDVRAAHRETVSILKLKTEKSVTPWLGMWC